MAKEIRRAPSMSLPGTTVYLSSRRRLLYGYPFPLHKHDCVYEHGVAYRLPGSGDTLSAPRFESHSTATRKKSQKGG